MSKLLQMLTNRPGRQVRVHVHQVTLKSILSISSANPLDFGGKLVGYWAVVAYKKENAGPVAGVQQISQDSPVYVAKQDLVEPRRRDHHQQEEWKKKLEHFSPKPGERVPLFRESQDSTTE